MSDLDKATRELFIRSLVDQVYMATPVLESIQRRNQVTIRGGTSIKRLVDTADIDDLAQIYTANTALRDEKKETLDKPSFTIRYAQLPLRYDVDDYLKNITAGTEEQLLDLASHLAQKGQRGVKIKMDAAIWNSGTATPVADGDTSKFQSIISALNHDTTYGTLSRSWAGGTNDYWQSADPAALNENVTTSAQDTAAILTRQNLRKWIYETSVAHNMESKEDLEIYMCPTLFNKLKAEMEAHLEYQPPANGQVSQKLVSMLFDGFPVISVPYLQKTATTRAWLFVLNMKWFEYRIHSERNFTQTPFAWQGENSNGYDFWLARIMWAGNLICWKPNSSLWLSSVS